MKKNLSEWLTEQQAGHPKKIDLGLGRIRRVYQRIFPNGVDYFVISVAGTNGKGSTVAMLSAIYQDAKYRTGAFTSPHLLNYNERFKIAGEAAAEREIVAAFEKIEKMRGDVSLSFFEWSALAALMIFAKRRVDIAILEVGLGGRLDAVNVVDANLAVITTVALDHQDYLGNNEESIGREKAGIMRAGKPCVSAAKNLPKSVFEYARKIGANMILADVENCPEPKKMAGEHQKQNAAAAALAVQTLKPFLPVHQKSIIRGIQNANLPGRLEIFKRAGKIFLLDVAHNVEAVSMLANYLTENPMTNVAIFAAFKDKDIKAMVRVISPFIADWYLVDLNNERAMTVREMAKLFPPEAKKTITKSTRDAILKSTQSRGGRVVVFGSFQMVAEALVEMKKPF